MVFKKDFFLQRLNVSYHTVKLELEKLIWYDY